MNYHNITTDDMLNGDGLRTVLWVAGCNHGCKGCQNPCTWDANGGLTFNTEAEQELFEKLNKPYIEGITFSGGDPLFPSNRDEIGRLVTKVAKEYPGKNIWLYTGYKWEEVVAMNLAWLSDVSVIIEGEYKEEERNIDLRWRGSTNQRVVNVKESLKSSNIVLWCE